jgi:hypothetical protein
MALHLIALILLFGAGIQNSTAEGTLEGRVLRSGSGEPLANMPVTLISPGSLTDASLDNLLDQMAQLVTIGLQGGGGGGSQDLTIRQVSSLLQTAGPGVGVQASVLTDRSGHFAFPGLPRGKYTVWVQRFNYYGPLLNGFPTSTVSATVGFDPARPLASLDLYMTQGLAITGRILDARGQPALGMPITAYRQTFSDGKPLWAPVLARPIDDRGEYRLSPLPPGEYYVGVNPPMNVTLPPGQNPLARTFFPGVTEPFEATKLVLKTTDMTGVDFSIRTMPSMFFKISGVALNPSPIALPNGVTILGFAAFALMPLETHLVDSFTPGSYANTVPAPNRVAGEFEIRNVRPGIYELYPLFTYSGLLSGRTIVDVRNADALGVQVVVNPVVNMQGRVVLTEANAQRPVKLDAVRVMLKQSNAPPVREVTPVPSPVNLNGEFMLSAPAAALATVQVIGLPDTAFVSDVRIGNASIFNDGFQVAAGMEPLQVLIDATTGGVVDASVRTPDGRPGARARVVLVPSEDRRQNPSRYVTAITDTEGHVLLRGVAPGAYLAFAWESTPETAWLNKDFLAKYLEQAIAITVGPRQQVNLQLKWIPYGS